MAAFGWKSIVTTLAVLIPIASVFAVASKAGWKQAVANDDGVYHLPAFSMPPSDLISEEAKRHTRLQAQLRNEVRGTVTGGQILSPQEILKFRHTVDSDLERRAEEVLKLFPVSVTPQMIGGVQTDILVPKSGISAKNRNRVLINLHAGAMTWGARYGGQVASIPIASLGEIKVITVDYRMAPEFRFPAASEDVSKVYQELLKEYRAENIGIYGCSAGGRLTASTVAFFQAHNLPKPGAISLEGSGAVTGGGDSSYFAGAYYSGIPPYPPVKSDTHWDWSNWIERDPYFQGADPEDPLVSPGNHPDVLANFPPTLIINATRDPGLSTAVYTHTQLVKVGVDAELHVWDGMGHCFSASDPNLPESREAYDVLVNFFDHHLGHSPHLQQAKQTQEPAG